MKQQLEIKKQLITPAIASELLNANVSNRRIKEPVVENLLTQINQKVDINQ